MTDLSGLLSCSYGTSNFQVETFSIEVVPVVKPNQGRTGTKVTMEVDGYVSADSGADLAATLAAVYADLSVDGRDFIIQGIGAPIAVLYAAQCADGGPHIEWRSDPDTCPLSQDFKLKVHGEVRGIGNPPKAVDTWKLTTRVRPDTLKEITRTGEVDGPNAPAYFLSTVLPAFEQAFPLPNWVTEFEYSTSGDAGKTKASYKTSARQVATPLPSAGLAEAVDGDSSVRIERDEQMRLVTTYEYDLVLYGSASAMLTFLRGAVKQEASAAGGIIWKESSNTTFIRERRLRCTFTTLQSGSGNPLMNFEQSIEIQRADDTYEVKTYAGADPVVVARPKTVEKLTQSGSATGAGSYLQAPAARYFSYLEPPDVHYQDLGDGVQYRTTWKYVIYTSGGGADDGGTGGDPTMDDIYGVGAGRATAALAPSGTAFNPNGTGLQFLARSQQSGFIKAGW